MRLKVAFHVCLCSAAVAFGADGIRLVEDGVAKCRVVVADDANRPEKFGAREIATYFDKVTGCGELDGAYPIRVTVDAANPDLREDGFILDVTPHGLTVTGANPRGALYGCYEILKRYAGMRWLVPGDDGEYCVHEGKSIVVPVGREVQNAYLRVRKTVANSEAVWFWHARNNMTCETGSWRFADRRTGKPTKLASRLEELCVKGVATAGNSHILQEMMSGWAGAESRAKMDALFAAHPEWFPLVGGRRVPIYRANDPNPCVSNAGLLDLMASNLYERVRGPHGSDDYVTIGNNDTTTWCECERCRALDAPELENTKGARADRYWHLVTEVARRVWARDPSIRLGGWCYQDFWYPPARVKIDPRLRVFVSFNNQCWRHSVDDERCSVNAEWRRIYKAWARLGLPLVVNRDEISTLGAPGSSFSPIERTLCENVLAYPSFGCSGSSLCVYAPFEHKSIYQAAPYLGKSDRWYGIWQGCYMIARMMWNPSGTNVDRDLEEACRLFYGEAAWRGGMREFRQLLTDAWVRTPGCYGWGLGAPLGRCLDQAGVEDRLVALLDDAMKAAEASGDARSIAHVRRECDMFELTWRKARKEYLENFKELTAYRQMGEIRIDGVLDEADWRNADVLGNFSPSESMRIACPDAKIQPSFVRIVYSPETLYIAVECMEPSPDKMIACPALPDDATRVWPSLGEHVELFYNYPDMGESYYHLIINVHGAFIAAVQKAAVVRTPLKTAAKWATKVQKDRWTLEVAIPTSEIGMKCFDGATWKVNVGRVRKSAELKTPRNVETSSCCNGKFHGALNFVNVKFAPRRAEGLHQGASATAWSNGGFEETRSNASIPRYYQWSAFTFPKGDDAVPAVWNGRSLRGRFLDEDGNRFVRILPGEESCLSQYFVSASPGSVSIRFRLRGRGRVSLETALYTDADGARGYRLQRGTVRTETFEATEAWRAVTVERTKNGLPTERLAVRFSATPGSRIDLDDVIVSPRPPDGAAEAAGVRD